MSVMLAGVPNMAINLIPENFNLHEYRAGTDDFLHETNKLLLTEQVMPSCRIQSGGK